MSGLRLCGLCLSRVPAACVAAILAVALASAPVLTPATAQDVRGLENCMVEKQVERRTGCLQANIEYLQQALQKNVRETQRRLDAASAEITALRAEAAGLAKTIGELRRTLDGIAARAPPAEAKK
ncbi:MAG: hypothetical protein KJZ73_15910 [Pseudorhodoplanes sp.]|nr:hypothetical protein [Pseudorhodoplanes sp.]MCL4712726.1 hypothetical protein [Pseudorhodoplanes sp.]